MRRSLSFAFAVSAAVFSFPASAEITATQAWDNLAALYGSMGLEIDATETLDGGTLTISDLNVAMRDPSEMTFDQALTGDFVFEELGNGTVKITPSDTARFEFSVDDGEAEIPIAIDFSHQGLEVIASGEPDDVVYDFAGDQITYLVSGLEAEQDQSVSLTFTGRDIRGKYDLEDGQTALLNSEFLANEMDIGVGVTQNDVSIVSALSQFQGVSISGMTALPDIQTLETGGLEALQSDIAIRHTGAEFAASVTDPNMGPTEISGGSDRGGFEFEINEEVLRYAFDGAGLRAEISPAALPVPGLGYAMDNYAFDLNLPIGVSEDPRDFNLLMRMSDLALTDAVWSLVDPAGALPHDPATLVVDVVGQANVLIDVFNSQFVEEPIEGSAAEIHDLKLNELRLSLAGAELTGDGAFTFDNEDLETFDGLPRPEGQVDLRITGVEALMEGLVQLGVLQEAQLVGARMMMAIFTNSVEGEDALTSTLEIDEAGSVFANGQQLR